MSDSNLDESKAEGLLRTLHEPRVQPPALQESDEAALLARWSARWQGEQGKQPVPAREPSRWLWVQLKAHRLAAALGALLLLVVAACVLPTSYEIPLGMAVEIHSSSSEELPVREMVALLRERSGAQSVEVIVRQHAGPDLAEQTQVSMRLWDQNLVVGEVEAELREQFPVLADPEIEIIETPLAGEVETIWARRVAHRAFHMALREADVEAAREQLLRRLEAQGFEAHEVMVEVHDGPDGEREIKIEVERRVDVEETGDAGPGEGDPALDSTLDWLLDPR